MERFTPTYSACSMMDLIGAKPGAAGDKHQGFIALFAQEKRT